MSSDDMKFSGKRMRLNSESKPSTVFSHLEAMQHSQQATDMEVEVVGHSVEVESSSMDNSEVSMRNSGEPPKFRVDSAEANIPTLCESENIQSECRRHETKTLDDTSDIDSIIHLESSKISVKTLRVVVPRMRVVCYSKEEEICGKKKMKNLWNDRPVDWPHHVPFKDPNNKGNEGRKASKEELVQMYEFLKDKYIQLPRTCAVEDTWSPGPKRQQQQPQPQLSVTHHGVKEEPVETTQIIHDPHAPESPFAQLYSRCEEKANRLLVMVDDNETVDRVKQVFESILLPLYRESGDMSAGCEFLDAGHQLETLLDVGLAYGKNTMHVIKQGCCELLDKFYPASDAGTQSVQIYTALNPQPQPSTLAPATGEHWGLNLRPNVSYALVQKAIETRPMIPQALNHDTNDDKKDLLKMAADQSGIIKMESDNVKVEEVQDLWDDVLELMDEHQQHKDEPALKLFSETIDGQNNQAIPAPEPFSFQDFLNDDTEVNYTYMQPAELQLPKQEQVQPNQPSLVLGPNSPAGSIPTTVEEMAQEQEDMQFYFN